MTDSRAHNPGRYKVTVAEAVTQILLREGIDRVFGVPGGYFTVLFDAFARAGLRTVEGRHESAAACMAAGFAQASGKVGVVHTQCGPGTTNAVTGFAAAAMDSVPLVLLASQTPRDDQGREGHQETTGWTMAPDQLDLYRSFAHCVTQPKSPASAARMMRVALNSAVGHRGPAAIELAFDLLAETMEFEDLPLHTYRSRSEPVDTRGVEEVCKLLAASRRPAVLVGNRVVHTGATEDLLAFCEEHQVACATVDYAKGAIPEDHPLSLGVLGQAGHESASEYFRSADFVLLIGVRMTQATTIRYQEALFRDAVQIDSDPRDIGRSLPVKLGLVGSIPATVRSLREVARGASTKIQRETTASVAELRRKHHTYVPPTPQAEGETVTPTHLFHLLREELPRETLLVTDVGWTAMGIKQQFPVYARDGFFGLYALAAMGSGMPLALGVQMARPDAPVVSVIGDGGFMVHTGELNVAAQHQLPVLHVVVKNRLYKSVADRQMHWYGRYYGTELHDADFARVAQGFGCDGSKARTAPQVRDAVRRWMKARRPAVIEVEVAQDNMLDSLPAEAKRHVDDMFSKRKQGWPMPQP